MQSLYKNNKSYHAPRSDHIAKKNISYIRKQIEKKNASTPYYAFQDTVSNVSEDLDHFPYTRFYPHFRRSVSSPCFYCSFQTGNLVVHIHSNF